MDVPECMNPSCAENRKLLPLLFYLSIFHWSISQVHPHRVYRQKMRVSGERSIPPRITTDSGSMDIPVTFSCAKNRKLILPWSILRVHPHHFYRQEMRSDWEKQKKKNRRNPILTRSDSVWLPSGLRKGSIIYVPDTVILADTSIIQTSQRGRKFPSRGLNRPAQLPW